MARYYRKMAILAKTEVTYGVDPVPTGLANAILMNDVTITPIAGSDEERALMTPALGHQGVIPVGVHTLVEGSVEIAAAGAAGTAPAWGVLMRMAGMSETITAAVKVDYKPVSAGFESGTIYFNADGVLHKLTGARASFSMDFTTQKIPRFRFRIMGLYTGPADAALPALTLAAWKKPVPVSKTATTLSLHGAALTAESLTINSGIVLEPRLLIGSDTIELTDRKMTGKVVAEAVTIAAKNWFSSALASTRGVLDFAHGTGAGNIVEIDAPVVEVGRPEQGQSQGILTYSLPLMLVPNAGDDELVISVK